MGVFIFLFSVLFILYFATINDQKASKSRIIQTIICTVLLVCIQGLRHEIIGVDSYNAYRPFFDSVSGGFSNLFDYSDVTFGFESGFVVFTKIVKSLVDDAQVYVLICSIISIVPISNLIYKYSDNIPFAFIVYSSFIVYHFGFSGIRQAMAIGMSAVAFEYVIRKKLVGFIIVVLIASTFHSSAILFLISYPVYHYLRLSPQRMVIVVCLFIVMLFFLDPIVSQLTELVFGGEKYMSKTGDDSGPSYNLMILLAAILAFSFTSKDSRMVPLRSMMLMTVLFQSLGLLSSSASRMAYYYMPYISIALPAMTKSFKLRMIIEPILLLLFIAFFFYTNASGYLEVIPYKFFWQ